MQKLRQIDVPLKCRLNQSLREGLLLATVELLLFLRCQLPAPMTQIRSDVRAADKEAGLRRSLKAAAMRDLRRKGKMVVALSALSFALRDYNFDCAAIILGNSLLSAREAYFVTFTGNGQEEDKRTFSFEAISRKVAQCIISVGIPSEQLPQLTAHVLIRVPEKTSGKENFVEKDLERSLKLRRGAPPVHVVDSREEDVQGCAVPKGLTSLTGKKWMLFIGHRLRL